MEKWNACDRDAVRNKEKRKLKKDQTMKVNKKDKISSDKSRTTTKIEKGEK